jgi:hypothetical protein
MNLKDITPKKTTRLNKVMESRFGFEIDFDNLSYAKAKRLSLALSEQLSKIRKSYGIHTAERNPKYMEMLMVQEGLNDWLGQHEPLMEGELETAEVVLAAKDMVDSVQKMLEDASKMMNEQLPPLVDSIKDQVGVAQADVYKNATATALQGLIDSLTTAREALDNGARGLSGEAPAEPMAAPAMPQEPGAELPPEVSDMDAGEELGGADETGLDRERR